IVAPCAMPVRRVSVPPIGPMRPDASPGFVPVSTAIGGSCSFALHALYTKKIVIDRAREERICGFCMKRPLLRTQGCDNTLRPRGREEPPYRLHDHVRHRETAPRRVDRQIGAQRGGEVRRDTLQGALLVRAMAADNEAAPG